MEFALNSAISNSSGFAPFELTYGYIPSLNPGLTPEPSSIPGVKHFVMRALQNLADAHDAIIESRVSWQPIIFSASSHVHSSHVHSHMLHHVVGHLTGHMTHHVIHHMISRHNIGHVI